MEIIERDVQKVINLLNANENRLNVDLLNNITQKIIFFKNLKFTNEHYQKSLIQDSLGLLDSLRFKSKRYYYFIFRSFIENSLRVILELDNHDETGVLKLFRDTKKILNDDTKLVALYEDIENQYAECCLFVHSNIKSGDDVSEFLKTIIDRNDFEDEVIKNEFLLKFKVLMDKFTTIFISCKYEIIEDSYYRNFDFLRLLISDEDYQNYRQILRSRT